MSLGRWAWTILVASVFVACTGFLTAGGDGKARAGGNCKAICDAVFGECYKANNGNRNVCDAERSACYEQCIKNGG